MSVPRISPIEAAAKMREGYTYVDVRSEDEFAEGHPDGAVNVPWLQDGPFNLVPNPQFLPTMEARFAKDARLVIGCKAGVRSAKATQALVDLGFGDVLEQRAGFDGTRGPFGEIQEPGWKRVGLPVRVSETRR